MQNDLWHIVLKYVLKNLPRSPVRETNSLHLVHAAEAIPAQVYRYIPVAGKSERYVSIYTFYLLCCLMPIIGKYYSMLLFALKLNNMCIRDAMVAYIMLRASSHYTKCDFYVKVYLAIAALNVLCVRELNCERAIVAVLLRVAPV